MAIGAPAAAAAETVGIVTASSLNLRKGPERSAGVIRTLQKGETIRILGESAGWLKVDHEGETGFVKYDPQWVKFLTPETAADADPGDRSLLGRAVEAVTRKLEARKAEVADDMRREKDVLERLNQINHDLNRTTLEVRALVAALETLSADIQHNQKEIKALEERIAETEAQASQRLVALYKLSWTGRVQFLLNATSINEFFERKRALNIILGHDDKVFSALLSDYERLSGLMSRLEARKVEKQQKTGALSARLKDLEAHKSRRIRLLAEIRTKKSLELAAIESLKASAAALDGAIQSFLQQAPPPQAEIFAGSEFADFKGLLKMPVEGKIVKFFGPYKNPRFDVMNFRSGIEIHAQRGEPIRSVGDGRVLFASWFKGFGNMLIIDHGKNYCTVYAHAEELFKQKGDAVQAQEVIATVGDTGSTPEPGLYFEVRHHGKPMNPEAWIHQRG
ncbi:MAG: peptidoglycan DD-metalloendopeptidase family protein [Desulfobacterales bacterium]